MTLITATNISGQVKFRAGLNFSQFILDVMRAHADGQETMVCANLDPAEAKKIADALDPGRGFSATQAALTAAEQRIAALTAENDDLRQRIAGLIEVGDALAIEDLANARTAHTLNVACGSLSAAVAELVVHARAAEAERDAARRRAALAEARV